MGDVTSQTYDSRGNVKTETDAGGVTTTSGYLTDDADPNRDLPKTETVPAPEPSGTPGTTTFTYDDYGNTTLIVQDIGATPGAAQSQFKSTYEPKNVAGATYHGALTKEEEYVSASEGWTEKRYSDLAPNGEPRQTQEIGVVLEEGGAPQTITTGATFDDFGNQLTSIGPEGNTTQTYTYDIAGNLKTSTSAASAASWYAGTLTAGSTPTTASSSCSVIHQSYDDWGRKTEGYDTATGDASGMKAGWEQATYDPCGRVATSSQLRWTSAQPVGQTDSTITHTYDGLGRSVASDSSVVANPASRTDYDAVGNVVASWPEGVTQSATAASSTTYDDANREETAVAPAATSAAVAGYSSGRLATQTASDGATITYGYDASGNVQSETSSVGAVATVSSNLGGSAASETGPSGLTTTYAYDSLGRVKSAQAAGSPPSTTVFNDPGWELSQTDAGLESTACYDVYGRTEVSQVGDQPEASFDYDACGRKTSEALPDGTVVTYAYDLFGDVSRETHVRSGATLHDFRLQFDSLGRPLARIDVVGGVIVEKETQDYPLNAPPQASETRATLTQNRATSAQVTTAVKEDSSGYESSRASSDAGGNAVTRTVTARDGAQRWTTVSLAGFGGSGALSLQREFRTDNGKLSSQSGAGITGSLTYGYYASTDAAPSNKFVGMQHTEQGTLALGPAINASYAYGLSGASIGRLTQAALGSDSWGFSYDAAGNLATETKNGATTTYSYGSNGLNRLQSATSAGQTTSYFWDENLSQPYGWRTSQGPSGAPHQITYGYAGNGELAAYSNSAAGNTVSAIYAYDGDGLRVTYSVTVNGGAQTVTSYTYSDDGSLLSLSANQGTARWSVDYLYDEEGVPYAGVYRSSSLSGPVFFAVVTNRRGDVLELLDANGSAFAAYRYDPYGVPTGSGNCGTGVWTSTTSLVNTAALAGEIASRQTLRYAGYVYDPESRLYYCQARYYDPVTRQWLTGDPAKDDGESSGYQYCCGSPVSSSDPRGTSMITVGGARWCGYHQKDSRVRGVYGEFTVAILHAGNEGFGAWVGMGGEYESDNFLQAGVDMDSRNAWYEWLGSQNIRPQSCFKVAEGDKMRVWIRPSKELYKQEKKGYQISITDTSKAVRFNFQKRPSWTHSATWEAIPASMADWIVERQDGSRTSPFSRILFSECRWLDDTGKLRNMTYGAQLHRNYITRKGLKWNGETVDLGKQVWPSLIHKDHRSFTVERD